MGKQSIIGGNQIKEQDLGKSIEMLRSNRTILVLPMNESAGMEPELTEAKSIKEAFEKYKPETTITVRGEDGGTEETSLRFNEIKDFDPESVVRMTPKLRSMKTEIAILQDLLKQVRQNPTLRKALTKPEERQRLLDGLRLAVEAMGQKGEEE